MEDSCQTLATESFSYSWLVNQTPDFTVFDEYLTSSPSPRDTSFNFDTSISRSSSFTFVHADEIFSDGHILPLFFDSKNSDSEPQNTQTYSIPDSIPISSRIILSDQEHRIMTRCCKVLKNWRKSSKRMIRRCLRILRTLGYKAGWSRKCIRVDDIDRKKLEVEIQDNYSNKKIDYRRLIRVKSWSNLVQEPVVPQSPHCSNNNIVSCDIESSIYEAVLHCKRSNENSGGSLIQRAQSV